MFRVIGLVVVPEECVIEPKLQNNRYKRQRDGEQCQHTEVARVQLPRINGHKDEPKRAVDHASDAEDQRVLNCLFDLVVYRGWYSDFV